MKDRCTRLQTASFQRLKHIITFGTARLLTDRIGRCQIVGGSQADRQEVLEWISLCAPELVPDISKDVTCSH
jgi:hypothetical protein